MHAAARCADFLLAELRDGGRLLRTWKDGRRIPAFLDDHAYLLQALLVLYEATFDPRWYREAVTLADPMIERFADRERGGFFTTAADVPALVSRRKDLEDSPIPAGNSAAAFGLLRLGTALRRGRLRAPRGGVLALLTPIAGRHPLAFGHALQALDLYLATPREVAIVGPGPRPTPCSAVRRGAYRPHLVLAGGEGNGVPLLRSAARSTAAPPPTCASASPARRRSPRRRSWRRPCDVSRPRMRGPARPGAAGLNSPVVPRYSRGSAASR